MGKGESTYLNGGWGIVKEGVKVRGVLSGFGCDFDMQDAVVDGKAHKDDSCNKVPLKRRCKTKSKDDTKEEANCGEDTGLTEAHCDCRVRVLGMREKQEVSPFAGTLQIGECSTG